MVIYYVYAFFFIFYKSWRAEAGPIGSLDSSFFFTLSDLFGLVFSIFYFCIIFENTKIPLTNIAGVSIIVLIMKWIVMCSDCDVDAGVII